MVTAERKLMGKGLYFVVVCLVLQALAFSHAGDAPTPLAWVGGEALTDRDLRLEFAAMEPGQRLRLLAEPMSTSAYIQALLKERVLVAEAERIGIARDPVVQRRIRSATAKILAEALRASVLEQIEDPDFSDLAHERYLADQAKYTEPERIKARHILLQVAGSTDLAEKKAELSALRDRIEAGESFEALAREHSDDKSSGERGGDLGFFSRGKMAPAFERAAFSIQQIGDLSDVVQTRFGLHLIQLVERIPARTKPFDEVEQAISSALRAEYRTSAVREWEAALIEQAGISLERERLEQFLETELARAHNAAQ